MAFPTLPVYDNWTRLSGAGAVPIWKGEDGIARWTTLEINNVSTSIENWQAEGGTHAFVGRDGSTLAQLKAGPDVGVALPMLVLPAQYIFLPVRVKNGGTTAWDGYGPLYGPAVGNNIQIRRYTNGASTVIKTIEGVTFVNGDSIGFTAVGHVLTVWRLHEGTWTELGSVEDSTYTEAGGVALWAGDNTGKYGTFSAGTISSGVVTKEMGGSATGKGEAHAKLRAQSRMTGKAEGKGLATAKLRIQNRMKASATGTGVGHMQGHVQSRMKGISTGAGVGHMTGHVQSRLRGMATGSGVAHMGSHSVWRFGGQAVGHGVATAKMEGPHVRASYAGLGGPRDYERDPESSYGGYGGGSYGS